MDLTAENIERIAKPFISTMGDHWCHELGIREGDVEDFALAIEKHLKGETK